MRRFAAAVCLCLLLICSGVFCAEEQSVVLLPKEVYVGDAAEVRYVFSAETCMLSADSAVFSAEELAAVWNSTDDFSVIGGSLSKEGNGYMLAVAFRPWVTGTLDFPPIDINALLAGAEKTTVPACIADIPPVRISSVAERLGAMQIQPAAAPPLVPGTTYAVYGAAAAALALLLGTAIAAVRFRRILFALRLYTQRVRQIRNYRGARARLRRLQKKKDMPLEVCAAEIEHVFRSFMESRFLYPFTALATQETAAAIAELTGNTAPAALIEAVDSLFRTCDCLRYAGGRCAACRGIDAAQLLCDAADCLALFERGAAADSDTRGAQP